MKVLDVFEECRERVSARQAAEFYGLEIDYRGWCRCPFHADTHASMSFRAGRFRCWSCGEHGDAVDLVGRLFALETAAALERLNTDFCLNLPLHRQQTPAERREAQKAAQYRQEINSTYQDFQAWRDDLTRQLNACFRLAHETLKSLETPADLDCPSDSQVLAIQWQPVFEHWADTLTSGEMSEIMQIFRERGVIQSRIDQILNHSPMKSGAA